MKKILVIKMLTNWRKKTVKEMYARPCTSSRFILIVYVISIYTKNKNDNNALSFAKNSQHLQYFTLDNFYSIMNFVYGEGQGYKLFNS